MSQKTQVTPLQGLIFLGVVFVGAMSGYQSLGVKSAIRSDRSAFVKRVSPEADQALGELYLLAQELNQRSSALAVRLSALNLKPEDDQDYQNLQSQLAKAREAAHDLQSQVDQMYLAHEKSALASEESVTDKVQGIHQRGIRAAKRTQAEIEDFLSTPFSP